jgi:hypothetical protein
MNEMEKIINNNKTLILSFVISTVFIFSINLIFIVFLLVK